MSSQLAGFAEAIAANAAALDLLEPLPGFRVKVLSDITTRVRGEGELRLRRFYWSAQRWRDGASADFAAETLAYYKKSGAVAWHTFPEDPDLASAGRVLAHAREARILRYVPLRRLTFHCAEASGEPVIAKIKRPDRFEDAAARLRMVGMAVARAAVSFEVPSLRRVDASASMFTQSVCEGCSLADVLTPSTAVALLSEVGRIHAEMHALEADTTEATGSASTLAQAQETAAWLGQIIPMFAGRLAACSEALTRSRPDDDTPVFCHGDFTCHQLLVAPGAWSVVDFDLCHQGSRYRDIAVLLASLPTDALCFRARDRRHAATSADAPSADASDAHAASDAPLARGLADAEAAYLASYADRAGITIDPARLHWHRACAELHYLLLMLKKDAYAPEALANGVTRIEAACEALAGTAPRTVG
jgi:Ser/Thr protein kinase RdoA (MazF antagonist)